MPDGGLITIKTGMCDLTGMTGLSGRFTRLALSDTGHGMSEVDRLRAFDPFFTTKDIGKGSGLGLSQVYGLAQQSGGAAHIELQPGRGTTVSIYLPTGAANATELDAAEPGPEMTVAPRSQAVPVLLLEDDREVREAIAAMLTSAGYEVTAYQTGREALTEVSGPRSIALMVIDYAMPAMRGDQFVPRWLPGTRGSSDPVHHGLR